MRALLWCSIVAVVALRITILFAGPDLDTDAYGHAMAGRFLLETPTDLRIHWVWLPLWHGVHGLIAAAGGALEEARLLNVVLGLVAPLLLARLLRRTTGDEALAVGAGTILALWPLGMSLGQSAQPEPLFQVLLLGACVAWEEDRPALTGALLGAAALCRYEAWVLPPVFLVLSWRRVFPADDGRQATLDRDGRRIFLAHGWWRGARWTLAWVLPGLVISGWCLVHGLATGEFLQFLRENRAFAREASRHLGFPWGPEPRYLVMALWYPLIRPGADLWHFAPLPLLGAVTLWHRQRERLRPPQTGPLSPHEEPSPQQAEPLRGAPLPSSLLGASVAILVFLSYGWVQRLNLGLPRHFYALVPLYATLTAAGLLALLRSEGLRGQERPLLVALRQRERPLLFVALLAFFFTRTAPAARWSLQAHRGSFPAARASAAALRRAALTPEDRVACDLSSVELIGRLPRGLLVRRPAASLRPADAPSLAPRGRLFVVARPRDVEALRPAARILHEDADEVVLEVQRPVASRILLDALGPGTPPSE